MKSIIKEIFYGNRGHSESFNMGEEYYKILGEVVELCKAFEIGLSDEKKEEFKKICNLQDDLDAETADKHFIEGVKLGILLGVEACN